MPAILTSIGALDPANGDALERYAAAVIPLIEAAGGTVLCRGATREIIVGTECPAFIAVMRFPDVEAIHRMFASDAYRAAIPDRQRAFQQLTTFVSDPV